MTPSSIIQNLMNNKFKTKLANWNIGSFLFNFLNLQNFPNFLNPKTQILLITLNKLAALLININL